MLDPTSRVRQRRSRQRRKQGRALLIELCNARHPATGRGSGPGAMVAPAAISAAVVDALIAKRKATDRHAVGWAIGRAVTRN